MPTENRSSNTEMVSAAPAPKRNRIYVEVRECEGCNHIGIDDAHSTLGACHECDWSGPEPVEDKCPGCGRENVIAAACPDCGSRYVLAASKEFEIPAPQYHAEPMAWMVGNAIWWDKAGAERDSAEVGLPVIALGPIADPGEVERLREVIKHSDAQIMRQSMRISNQRAKLAELETLLHEAWPYDLGTPLKRRIKAALSASAEPIQQKFNKDDPNGQTDP